MERPSVQRRQGERRRLWDRRSPDQRRGPSDRRARDRRSEGGAPSGDRRRSDRRHGDRRVLTARRRGRRRRDTPTPYTAEQIDALRAGFAAPGPVTCPACGSRFTLGPGRRRGAEIARRVACLGCGRGAVVPNTRAARILLVARSQEVRDSLQRVLGSAGHEVVEADDATVGLAAYQVVPTDLVIIDVLAPGRMGAPDFLRRLRRLFPDARVVALAGRASWTGVDPLAVTQGLGAARSIRMPIGREDLLRIVDEVRH